MPDQFFKQEFNAVLSIKPEKGNWLMRFGHTKKTRGKNEERSTFTIIFYSLKSPLKGLGYIQGLAIANYMQYSVKKTAENHNAPKMTT